MLKTFTLDKRTDKKISSTEGTVTFYITDENGDSREITCRTHLDENKIPQGITSKNKRELPLAEGLFRLEIDETIEIEFKQYNDQFDRDLNKTANQVAYDKVLEMQKEQKIKGRIARFFSQFKSRNIEKPSTTA